MISPSIYDLRALRLCNPPALRLRFRGTLYGPPLAKEAVSVLIFMLMTIPIESVQPPRMFSFSDGKDSNLNSYGQRNDPKKCQAVFFDGRGCSVNRQLQDWDLLLLRTRFCSLLRFGHGRNSVFAVFYLSAVAETQFSPFFIFRPWPKRVFYRFLSFGRGRNVEIECF